jgi:hypothetical protein
LLILEFLKQKVVTILSKPSTYLSICLPLAFMLEFLESYYFVMTYLVKNHKNNKTIKVIYTRQYRRLCSHIHAKHIGAKNIFNKSL